MNEFWCDLLANILGGVVAAGLVTLAAYLWNKRRNKIMEDLIAIMGQAIEHRNFGERNTSFDKKEWVTKAKMIEVDIISKGKKLSPATGALFEYLDRVPPHNPNNEVEKYVAILSTIILRLRELVERKS